MLFLGFLLGQTSGAVSPSDSVWCRVGRPLQTPACPSLPTPQSPYPPKSSKEGLRICSHHGSIFPFCFFCFFFLVWFGQDLLAASVLLVSNPVPRCPSPSRGHCTAPWGGEAHGLKNVKEMSPSFLLSSYICGPDPSAVNTRKGVHWHHV